MTCPCKSPCQHFFPRQTPCQPLGCSPPASLQCSLCPASSPANLLVPWPAPLPRRSRLCSPVPAMPPASLPAAPGQQAGPNPRFYATIMAKFLISLTVFKRPAVCLQICCCCRCHPDALSPLNALVMECVPQSRLCRVGAVLAARQGAGGQPVPKPLDEHDHHPNTSTFMARTCLSIASLLVYKMLDVVQHQHPEHVLETQLPAPDSKYLNEKQGGG